MILRPNWKKPYSLKSGMRPAAGGFRSTSLEFPNAGNTGVPSGQTLTNSGDLTLSTPGATVSNLNVSGTVTITAANVTLMNCRITTSHASAVVTVNAGGSGAIIRDCEINGGGSSTYGILSRSGATGNTYLRCNIHGSENGIDPGNNDTVRDSYIWGILNTDNGDPHYDGIEFDGGNGLLIEHNTVDMHELTQNAAVNLDNFFTSLTNVIVRNNLVRGAHYTIWLDASFGGGSVSNISLTDNRMQQGATDYFNFTSFTPIHTGNVDWSTLASVD